jgi:hypothetical protein
MDTPLSLSCQHVERVAYARMCNTHSAANNSEHCVHRIFRLHTAHVTREVHASRKYCGVSSGPVAGAKRYGNNCAKRQRSH